MTSILVVEDDPAIVKGLQASLSSQGYQVTVATDGQQGLARALEQNFSLILLDVMLPKLSGYDVCRQLRAEGVQSPLLMLTSKKSESDKILGLELGADDYITKPFSLGELLARIRAALRRAGQMAENGEPICFFGRVQIDFKRRECRVDSQPQKLSAKEYELLHYLTQHEREVVTRDTLLDEVWGYDHFPTTRTVDTFILNLRKKLEEDPAHPRHLLTIHGTGYKFVK